MYAIGCTLASIIIVPFLEKANENGSIEAPCPGKFFPRLKYYLLSHLHFIGEKEDENPDINDDGKIYIFYGYLIPAVLVAIVGCAWIYITFAKILDPIREKHIEESDLYRVS